MAITVALFGPTKHLPHLAMKEFQTLRLVGDGTQVIVAAGAGILHAVHVGIVGTLAIFYDVASGGTVDDTTACAKIATTAIGRQFEGDIAFSQGLTVVTTGASDLTIEFWGRGTVANPRQFGVA